MSICLWRSPSEFACNDKNTHTKKPMTFNPLLGSNKIILQHLWRLFRLVTFNVTHSCLLILCISHITNKSSSNLLWFLFNRFVIRYKLSEHRVPPVYELQSVESCIPQYHAVTKNNPTQTYEEGFQEWEKELIRMRNVLCQPNIVKEIKEHFISSKWSSLKHISSQRNGRNWAG